MRSMIEPSGKLINIVKSDTTTYSPELRAIYCGGAGDITIDCQYEDSTFTSIVFKNVQAGTIIAPFFAVKVRATGTTATDLVGFV